MGFCHSGTSRYQERNIPSSVKPDLSTLGYSLWINWTVQQILGWKTRKTIRFLVISNRTILEAGSVWRKFVELVTPETITDKKLMTPGAEQPNVWVRGGSAARQEIGLWWTRCRGRGGQDLRLSIAGGRAWPGGHHDLYLCWWVLVLVLVLVLEGTMIYICV